MKEYFVVLRNGVSFFVKASKIKYGRPTDESPFQKEDGSPDYDIIILPGEISAVIPADRMPDQKK